MSCATRALDKPDVPLVISLIKFIINIILDFLIISKFHVGKHVPTINNQAATQLACGLVAGACGVLYFCQSTASQGRTDDFDVRDKSVTGAESKIEFTKLNEVSKLARPIESNLSYFRAIKILIFSGCLTALEFALRNAVYLWLVHNIVSLGSTYATAWGVFIIIRWGLVMVPVQALEATSSAWVGHQWGKWRHIIGWERIYPPGPISYQTIFFITRPAIMSIIIAVAIEVPLALILSLCGTESFAKYLCLLNT